MRERSAVACLLVPGFGFGLWGERSRWETGSMLSSSSYGAFAGRFLKRRCKSESCKLRYGSVGCGWHDEMTPTFLLTWSCGTFRHDAAQSHSCTYCRQDANLKHTSAHYTALTHFKKVFLFCFFTSRMRPTYLDDGDATYLYHGDVRPPVPVHCPTRRRLVVAPPTLRPGSFPA